MEVVDFFTADGTSISANELRHHGKVKGLLDLAIGKNTQAMFDVYHKVIGGNATDQALLKLLVKRHFVCWMGMTDVRSVPIKDSILPISSVRRELRA